LAKAVKPLPAALGFRVKSGWAMAVLLTGPADKPQLVKCSPILLSDPNIPGSKQPYHAALDLPREEAKAVTRSLRNVVSAAAKKSVKELLEEARALSYEVRAAALVVGSLVDPATLHNDHMRAHGYEGRLFRVVLKEALRPYKIPCVVFIEKNAYEAAAPVLRITPPKAKLSIAVLGKSQEGSWRAEEKLAALGAWMALAARGKAV
jgi:hypothetical protein